MHVKMFDMPDSVPTKDLLSGFADDKFNNRLRIVKNRNSLRVNEEEGKPSGVTDVLLTMLWMFFFSFSIDTVFF